MPRPSSTAAAIAASGQRARILAGMQAIALVAIVLASSLRSRGAPGPSDGGVPPPADAGRDAWIDGGAFAAIDAPPTVAAGCADQAACSAACLARPPGRGPAGPCVRWADMLRTARERIKARDVYRSTCDDTGDALACTRLALGGGLLHDLDLANDWLFRPPLDLLRTACTLGGERGKLACAALELLGDPPSAADPGDAACEEAGDYRAGCAARIALAACRTDADAEACYLAARDGVPTRDDASGELTKLCSERGDRPACLYRYLLSPPASRDRASLLTACSDISSEKELSIPRACLVRSLAEPARREFPVIACELGSCQDPKLPPPAVEVLARSCDAGHLNGCANLIYARRADPVAWKAVLGRVQATLRPHALTSYVELRADEHACVLGSLAGCDAAIARRSINTKVLAAHRARLIDPMAGPRP